MMREPLFYFEIRSYNTTEVFFASLYNEIYTEKQLFDALYNILWFPGYFGFNWNALFDCLKDFHWIEPKLIVLSHHGVPKISDPLLKIYLNILQDSVAFWRSTEGHQFDVLFRPADKARVLDLMQA